MQHYDHNLLKIKETLDLLSRKVLFWSWKVYISYTIASFYLLIHKQKSVPIIP